jgi:hypothetical protein
MVLTNFPLDYNDQISVIEIFNGLMGQRDGAANAMEDATGEPIRSLSDLPDTGCQRGSSDPNHCNE